MTASEHLTIKGPEDILGFIPHSLGYWPADSLVAMTMQGKRLGATLRVDLPGPDGLRNPGEFARTVGDYLQADDAADGTLLMLFTNDGWMDSDDGYRPLLAALEAALGCAGMPVRDAWYVGHTHWRNVYCTDPGCCPLPGRSVDEIRDSRLNAEMVFRGSSVGAPPADRLYGEGQGQRGREETSVVAAEQRWLAEFNSRRGSRQQFDAVLDTWERAKQAGQGTDLTAALKAFLRASLCVPAWRDAVLVMTAAGRAAAARGAEEFGIFDDGSGLAAVRPPAEDMPQKGTEKGSSRRPDDGSAAGYGEVLLGLSPVVPDWAGMKRLEQVLLRLSCAGGAEAEAAALTARGWIEWCRGRGSFADALLNQALVEQNGYRLAELLSELVGRGTICGWAGRRETAWQKFEPDAA
ncbi:DUF4192 domain-containing protein [Micrococcaceae bacterium Sec5.7]